jgi:BMFP domain-containing protein YqiC
MQFSRNRDEIDENKDKLSRARTRHDIYNDRIEELEAQNELLAKYAVKVRLLKAAECESNGR